MAARSPPRWARILRSPAVLLILGLAIMILGMGVASILVRLSGEALGNGDVAAATVSGAVIEIAILVLAYWFFVRVIEGGPFTDFGMKGAPGELAAGIGLGALLMSLTIGAMALLGVYHVTGANPATVLLPAAAAALATSVGEEILLRGVVFRQIERGLGSWIALLISALLFGFLHMGNDDSSLLAGAAIALQAGILLAAVYMVTRRLWAAIGVHASWNFFQGGVYGVPVSGRDPNGLLISERTGPPLLSGGEFGAEASIIAVLVAVVAGVWALRIAWRRGRFVAPFWSRRRDSQKPAATPGP
jgi:membrane protease YdiL (CAAX protease family)